MKEKKIHRSLFILIIISTIIRGFLAWFIEFGNDEVYYWTYALYPDLSHFDHPPMVGYLIQLFTLNLNNDTEFFIRLPSVIFGAVNTWLIFMIGKRIKDAITGFYAAILYTASIYCFIIAGTFILPDTPQLFFWLLGLYFLINAMKDKEITSFTRKNMLFAGIAIGLGMLSKYTSIFLWIGAGLYILFYSRKWLLRKEFYFAMMISAIVFIPVIVWNIQNDFISFSFQGERVDIFKSGVNLNAFITELSGQIFYNNPVNFILIILALIYLINRKKFIGKASKRLLLWTSIPIVLLFLAFSLFRSTLPHWTGPGYIGLILLASAFISEWYRKKTRLFPWPLKASLIFMLMIIILGAGQVRYGLLFESNEKEISSLGKKDISLDMYGWRQLGEKFGDIYQRDIENKTIDSSSAIVSYRWFPAANLDYYVARPLDINVKAIGTLERIHKYAWINNYRGGFDLGENDYFITDSRDFKDPFALYNDYYEEIIPTDTISIRRNDKAAKNFFIYRMKNLKKIPENIFHKKTSQNH